MLYSNYSSLNLKNKLYLVTGLAFGTRYGRLLSRDSYAQCTVSPFVVNTPTFTGTLGELAYALRNDTVKPQQFDVFQLVKTYLCYFEEVSQNDLDLASEALPMVARVVELKVRLLLPRPPERGGRRGAARGNLGGHHLARGLRGRHLLFASAARRAAHRPACHRAPPQLPESRASLKGQS